MKRLAACALVLAASAVGAQNWPSFRGPNASGVAAAASPPVEWDVRTSRNVAWKTAIPGLAHSSPIVWGDRVYLTTAVPLQSVPLEIIPGDYSKGGVEAAKDVAPHSWRLYALDRRTGKLLWQRTLEEGVPRVKRHRKASHASATPATDGRYIVALLGSQGLYCTDMNGKRLWKQDLGVMDTGEVDAPEYQWGPASSPLIYKDLVIVQNDRQRDSFLAAYDLRTGKEVWKASRDEWPAWSSPVIFGGPGGTQLITNSSHYIRGYDPSSGKELWRYYDHDAQMKIASPVAARDLVLLTGGAPGGTRPIYAFRSSARGNISLARGESSSAHIAWKTERGSPSAPTPLALGDRLYVIGDKGVLSAYNLGTGERIIQQRLAAADFSASPVAAGDKLYFTSEDGDIYVLRAGDTFDLLGTNRMGELCLATPAISGDMLIVRTLTHVFGIRQQ